jgi:hypothetical protein
MFFFFCILLNLSGLQKTVEKRETVLRRQIVLMCLQLQERKHHFVFLEPESYQLASALQTGYCM